MDVREYIGQLRLILNRGLQWQLKLVYFVCVLWFDSTKKVHMQKVLMKEGAQGKGCRVKLEKRVSEVT